MATIIKPKSKDNGNSSSDKVNKVKEEIPQDDNAQKTFEKLVYQLFGELNNYKIIRKGGNRYGLTEYHYQDEARLKMFRIPAETPTPPFPIDRNHISSELRSQLVEFKDIYGSHELGNLLREAAGLIFNNVNPAYYVIAVKQYLWVQVVDDSEVIEKDRFDDVLLGDYKQTVCSEQNDERRTVKLYDGDINYVVESLMEYFVKDGDGITEGLAKLMFSEEIDVMNTEKIISNLCRLTNSTEFEERRLKTVRQIYLQASKNGITNIDKELLTEKLAPFMDGKTIDNPTNFINNLSKIWRRYSSPVFSEIPENMIEKLAEHTFEVISDDPKQFVIARTDKKQVSHALMSIHVPKKSKQEEDLDEDEAEAQIKGIPSIKFKDVIINAIPTEIQKYENPASHEIKYEMEWQNFEQKFKIEPMPLDQIVAELKARGLIYKIRSAEEALPQILNAYLRDGKVTVKNEIDTEGFYLIDGKIVPVKVDIKNPSKDEITRCIDVLEKLLTMLKHQDRFATYMKWGLAAPFSFVMKQLDDEQFWLPYLFLDGFTRVGKTTDGVIILAINRKHTHKDRRKHNIGFASMDNVAKFGLAGSYNTFPVLANEVELSNLRDLKTKPLVEAIKHSVQNETSRSRFAKNRKLAEHFSALSPFVFTSNDSPPEDAAFLGRMIRIHHTEVDKPTEKERINFDKYLFKERHLDELGSLGDFAASYMLEHQELIHEDWKSWTKTILVEFYKAADKKEPEWINEFVPETQIEEVLAEREQLIRSFFEKSINDTYRNSFTTYTNYNSERENVTFTKKLDFCLSNQLISYLRRKGVRYDEQNTIFLLHDVMKEIQKSGINHVHGLKDLAGIIGAKEESPKINGTTTRVIKISKSKLVEFILPDLAD